MTDTALPPRAAEPAPQAGPGGPAAAAPTRNGDGRADRRTWRNVWVLVAAQAVLGSQITMIFTIGGLAGQMLSPIACLATLPISLIVFGSMTSAPWMSALMQARGRRTGFLVGATGGLIGSAVSALGLMQGNFWVFLIGAYMTGIYMSAQGFYRFAVTDTAPDAFKPKAISYVMAGGLVSALIGPQLVKVTAEATVVPFLGTYAIAMAINLFGMALFFLLDIPRPPAPTPGANGGRTVAELLRTPRVAVAILCAMVSYALMNLVMTSTPLAMRLHGATLGDTAFVIQWHVVAMFAPSFATGHLIARLGLPAVLGAGVALGLGCVAVNLAGETTAHFTLALALLGVSWNFLYVGGTTLLTSTYSPAERSRAQALNDFLVFGAVSLTALSAGGLHHVLGWRAVNLAVLPLLGVTALAVLWLARREGTPPAVPRAAR